MGELGSILHDLDDGVTWSMLVATLLGIMVGFERERKRERGGHLVAGVRTFTLIALLGSVAGVLVEPIGVTPLLVLLAGLIVLVVLGYWRVSAGDDLGATTEVAALVTFVLGVVAGLGAYVPALAGSVIATGVLSLRDELHHLAGDLTREDLLAAVRFAVLSLVILPLVPNEALGPWGVWNPRTIWWMVVLISGVSFLGYAAIKGFGPRRGIGVSGILGGLTSSTAVTWAFARRARDLRDLVAPLAFGVLAASTVAGPRLLVLIGVVAPDFVLAAGVPIVAMALVLGVGALAALRQSSKGTGEGLEIRNPFELRSAFTFALAFALIVFIVRAARETLGDAGVLVASTLAGLTDLDAISLSLAEQRDQGLATAVATQALGLAAASNCVFKGMLAWLAGGGALGRSTTPWLLAAAAAAIAAAYWGWPWIAEIVSLTP